MTGLGGDRLNKTLQRNESSGDGSSGLGFFDDDEAIHFDFVVEFMDNVAIISKLIGFVGNLLIICYFVVKNKQNLRKMSTYHFLLSMLAIFDFLVCVILVIIYMEISNYIQFNRFVDNTLHFIKGTLWRQCMFLIFLVSLLRYQSIVHPFKPRWTKFRYFCISMATFATCMAISIQDMLLHNLEIAFDLMIDAFDSGVTFLFLVIFIVFYYKMSKALKESQESRSKEHNKKALKTLRNLLWLFAVTLVLSKIILASLINIFTDINEAGLSKTEIDMISYAEIFFTDLIYWNNIGNFFIYLKMMPEFRRFMRNLLCCRSFRKKAERNG